VNSKGQSAIEYLTTYGWMLLVVALVGGIVFSIIGSSGSGTEVMGFQDEDIQVFEVASTQSGNLSMSVRNRETESATIKSANITTEEGKTPLKVQGQQKISRIDTGSIQLCSKSGNVSADQATLNIYYSGDINNLVSTGEISNVNIDQCSTQKSQEDTTPDENGHKTIENVTLDNSAEIKSIRLSKDSDSISVGDDIFFEADIVPGESDASIPVSWGIGSLKSPTYNLPVSQREELVQITGPMTPISSGEKTFKLSLNGTVISRTVDVKPGEQPVSYDFRINTINLDDSIFVGETANIYSTIQNDGSISGTQKVNLTEGGDLVDSKTINLGAGEGKELKFDWDTDGLETGEYELAIKTSNETKTANRTLLEPAPRFEYDIVGNDPVVGNQLQVDLGITNKGVEAGSVQLAVEPEGISQSNRTVVDLAAGASTTLSYSYPTDGLEPLGQYSVNVSSNSSTGDESVEFTVRPQDAYFKPDLRLVEGARPLKPNTNIGFDVFVENRGGTEGTQQIKLNFSGFDTTTKTKTLDSGEFGRFPMTVNTGSAEGSVTVRLSTENETVSKQYQVQAPEPDFSHSVSEANIPVSEGEALELEVEVSNDGTVADTQTLEAQWDDVGSDSVEVSLNAGESKTENLTIQTEKGDAGTHNLTISTENSSETVPLSIGRSIDEGPPLRVEWSSSIESSAEAPGDLALDGSGNVYASGYFNEDILASKLDQMDGSVEWTNSTSTPTKPKEMVTTGDGVLISSTNDSSVYVTKFGENGDLAGQSDFGSKQNQAGGLAINADGDAGVTGNDRIRLDTLNGTSVVKIVSDSNIGLVSSESMASEFISAGSLTSGGVAEKGILMKSDGSGQQIWNRTIDTSGFTSVAVSSNGNIYASGFNISGGSFESSIYKFSESGNQLWRTGKMAASIPVDVELDSNGNLIVSRLFQNQRTLGNISSSGDYNWRKNLDAPINLSGSFFVKNLAVSGNDIYYSFVQDASGSRELNITKYSLQ
jgi:hypothetical protein